MATTNVTSAQACLNLIEPLDSIIGSNAPNQVQENIAVLAALKSPQNVAGLREPTVTGNDGKNLRVQYDYFEPECVDTEDAAIPDFCELAVTNTGSPRKSVGFDMAGGDWRKGVIEWADYKAVCANPSEVQSFEIANAGYQILRDMQGKIYPKMHAAGDKYFDGVSSAVTPRTLNLISDTGGVNLASFVAIKKYFDKHGKTPLMVGGTKLGAARDIIELSNRQGGVDFAPEAILTGMPIWTDHLIDEKVNAMSDPVGTDSHAIAWTPGAFRLIEGYNNVGDYEIATELVTRTTVTLYGVDFDFYLKFDPECLKLTWLLAKKWDLFSMPQTLYQDCESSFTSKLNFKIGAGAWAASQLDI